MDKNRLIRKSFDLGSASLVFLVAFGAQLVFQLIVIALGLSDGAKTWTIVIGNQLVLLAVTLAFCFGKKVDFLEITGLRRPPRWYYFPLFILIAFACVATFAPLAGVFSHLLSKLGYDYNPTYYIPTESKGLFTLAFLALTLLPLLGEETACDMLVSKVQKGMVLAPKAHAVLPFLVHPVAKAQRAGLKILL